MAVCAPRQSSKSPKKSKSIKTRHHIQNKEHTKNKKHTKKYIYKNVNKINIKYNKHHNASRTYYKKNIHNHKSSLNLFNRNSKNDGRLNFRNDKGNIESKLDLGLTMKGGESIDKYTKRRLKYMDLFTLSQFQLRKKSIKLSKNLHVSLLLYIMDIVLILHAILEAVKIIMLNLVL